MPPFIVFLALAGALEGGKAYFQSSAAEQQEQAIENQMQQEHLQYQQKRLQNYDLAQRVLATQTAQATTRGVALSSPSFNAIQRDTLNKSAREGGNLEIEEDLLTRYRKAEKSNVRNTLYAQLFGDAADTVKTAYTASGSVPT